MTVIHLQNNPGKQTSNNSNVLFGKYNMSSFLLVSATYLHDHLEPDAQSMWGNFHPHSKLTIAQIPIELTPFQTITNPISFDLPKDTKKKD